MINMLLRGTVNSRLAYVFISRNLLHGNRNSRIVRDLMNGFNLGVVHISTGGHFVSGLTNIDSPRRGHGVVNGRFICIFSSRTAGLRNVSFLTRKALCASIVRDKARATRAVGSRRGMNKLPRSVRFGLVRPLGALFGSRIHRLKARLNVPSDVI